MMAGGQIVTPSNRIVSVTVIAFIIGNVQTLTIVKTPQQESGFSRRRRLAGVHPVNVLRPLIPGRFKTRRVLERVMM